MLEFPKQRPFSRFVLHSASCAGLLLCAALLGAQQRNPVPDNPNAPNSKPAHAQATPTKEVQEKLQKGFDNKNAAYAGSNIQTSVNDQNVTLTGTVTSELQHEMALQLVRAYAGDRKIVDKLIVQQ